MKHDVPKPNKIESRLFGYYDIDVPSSNMLLKLRTDFTTTMR
jgi:hypothetical protein